MNDKERLLKHLREDVYCRVGASAVHGAGVIAIRKIPKGIDPLRTLIPRDEIELTSDDLKGLPRSVVQQMEMFCYFEGNQILASAHGLNTVDLAVYVNHSKTPNLQLIAPGHFETLRVINEGEELFMDYDITFGETHIFE